MKSPLELFWALVFGSSLLLFHDIAMSDGIDEDNAMKRVATELLKESTLPPLCQSDEDYFNGAWVFNASISTYPYLSADDDEWGPQCTDLQRQFLATGAVPDFLKYTWQPNSCRVAQFDSEQLCRIIGDNVTVSMIGDSMNQQFAHSLLGRMWHSGDMVNKFDASPYDDGEWGLRDAPLCPGINNAKFHFYRWNKYEPQTDHRAKVVEAVEKSDYLILNFGVHYMPWLEYETAMKDLIELLEKHVRRDEQKLFWRSTISSHANCSDIIEPDNELPPMHENYGADEILLQDAEIMRPRLLQSSLDIKILRIELNTLLRRDGHRVIGHNGASDCLHYCEPGPTDSWVDLLFHHLVLMNQGITWTNA